AECIRSLAALADGEDQRFRSHRRVTMTELARVFDFGRNTGKSLDQIFADSPGVKRRAATGKNDATDIANLRKRHVQAAQFCGAFFGVETTAHRVAYRVWLLKDFFEHVMRIIAFSDVFRGEFDFADWMFAAVSRERSDLELVASRCDHIEVV